MCRCLPSTYQISYDTTATERAAYITHTSGPRSPISSNIRGTEFLRPVWRSVDLRDFTEIQPGLDQICLDWTQTDVHINRQPHRHWLRGTWTLLPSLYKAAFVKEHFSWAGAPPLSFNAQSQLIINSVNFCHLSAEMHHSTSISFAL